MNEPLLIRLSFLLVIYALNAVMCEAVIGQPYLDMVFTVRVGAWTVLFTALYVSVWNVLGRRPLVKEMPPLTFTSVWNYVYGLGLLTFTLVYCLLGVNLNATFTCIVSLSILCVDDMLNSRTTAHGPVLTAQHRVCTMLVMALLVAGVFPLVLDQANTFAFGEAVDTGDWFTIGMGVVLPTFLPFLLHSVRTHRRATAGMVLEVLHFAMPFAAILSLVLIFALSACSEPRTYVLVVPLPANVTLALPTNDTLDALYDDIQHSIWVPFLPATMAPVLFFTVQTVLLYRSVDFLATFALVAVVRHLVHNVTSVGSQIGVSLVGASLLLRLALGNLTQEKHDPITTRAADVEEYSAEHEALTSMGFEDAAMGIHTIAE